MKYMIVLMLCATAILANDTSSIKTEKKNPLAADRKITLAGEKRALIHHISIAQSPKATEELKKTFKFYGVLAKEQPPKPLKSQDEVQKFTGDLEMGNFYCYKLTKNNAPLIRVFFGSQESMYMKKYYAHKNLDNNNNNNVAINNVQENK